MMSGQNTCAGLFPVGGGGDDDTDVVMVALIILFVEDSFFC